MKAEPMEGDLIRLTSPDIGSGSDEYVALMIGHGDIRYANRPFYTVLIDGEIQDVDSGYWEIERVGKSA